MTEHSTTAERRDEGGQFAVNRDALDRGRLRHPDSVKWTKYPADVIPLWVADMDFPVAPAILAALHDRLTFGIGYAHIAGDPALSAALHEHLVITGLSDVPAAGLEFLTGVVAGLYAAVNGLTSVGDKVITMVPIYRPFHKAITDLGREVVGVPLVDSGERFEIDWEAMEAAAAGAKLLMLCHPHNPTGRIWDGDELTRLRDLVLRHDLVVIVDELHADLNLGMARFESFAADPRVRGCTLTVTGPCKAYNTAGLGIGVMIGHDLELLDRVKRAAAGLLGHPSALSIAMWRAALAGAGPWLQDTLTYLRGNHQYLAGFVRDRLPLAGLHPVEGTYLAWLDLRRHRQAGAMVDFLLDHAKVAVHGGEVFAPDHQQQLYSGFVRINFATSREILEEALERIAVALAADSGWGSVG
ncbi:MAG: aminotransferase class I/II-fold pyridoxal phosphate-dependent enzyme [Ilumatobacteraceae bacterium]